MSDLRAMLGDRYDDVIIKATKRALLNYPNLPISIPQHEALAGQALAAVLPGLLAQAWDEGFTAGVNADMGDYEHPDDGSWHTNPYRQEAENNE